MSEDLPRQLSARVDQSLAQDVKLLRRTGLSYSEMIKTAIHMMAMICHTAWINRAVPVGEVPELIAYKYRMTPKPAPIEGELNLQETPHEEDRADHRRRSDRPARLLPDLDAPRLRDQPRAGGDGRLRDAQPAHQAVPGR
ncbi:hypothetical protein D854_gp17 [Streptomyces phage R4]|uniref:Uncharacterized protein n=1 Tax=Streptomyces phage R4 TaxID=10732 RepID=K4I2S4_9CAUD|nr:hypothetical protein D854_gp17 [Streptomyces phage R4]AFU62125.1 hypothetical protein R4_70 [Streptomyces phage R4]